MIYLIFGFKLQVELEFIIGAPIKSSFLAFTSPLHLSPKNSSFWLQGRFLWPEEHLYWLRPSEVRTLETWLSISSCKVHFFICVCQYFLFFFFFINAFVFFTIRICVCRYLYLCMSTWFLTWERGEGEGVVEGIGDPVRFGAATENSQR